VTPSPTDELLPTQVPLEEGPYPKAAYQAQADLAKKLNIPVDSIIILDVQAVNWPDGCLGLGQPDEMCLQAITPGYLVTLQVDLQEYYYHTDERGITVRMAAGPGLPAEGSSPESFFQWEGPGCETLQITHESISYGHCNKDLIQAGTPLQNWETYLVGRLAEYRSFETQTALGNLQLRGAGRLIASSGEQRALAERARLVFVALETGQAGAASSAALTFKEEGGIAGLCNSLVVYLDGWVDVSDCRGIAAHFDLTAGQLEELYGWLDRYQAAQVAYEDYASADALRQEIQISGSGKENPGDEVWQQILDWARGLIAQSALASQAEPVDLADAQAALRLFLNALAEHDYRQAASWYAPTTDILKEMNPDAGDDLEVLLGLGCKFNGFQCLQVRSITPAAEDEQGFHFWVEFSNPDGTLFQRGPCCGDTSGSTEYRFWMTVTRQGKQWKVADLPPYVP
jgi:hypothetical protein